MFEYKGYRIETHPKHTLKLIKSDGRGSVNKELRGMYTSTLQAEKAIDKFLVEQSKNKGKIEDAQSEKTG